MPRSQDVGKPRSQRRRATISRLLRILRAKELEAEGKLLRGTHAEALVLETPQNIRMLTSSGRSRIARWALSSVADALVRA